MSIEIKIPILPESITEGTIAKWYKKIGEAVRRDESLLDVETDKVVLEVVAPEDGFLESILKKEGDTVTSQEVVAQFKPGKAEEKKDKTAEPKSPEKNDKISNTIKDPKEESLKKVASSNVEADKKINNQEASVDSPSVRRKKAEAAELEIQSPTPKIEKTVDTRQKNEIKRKESVLPKEDEISFVRKEERVPMSRIRARIAERLVEAQHNAAILTTFNEVNMLPIMELRQKYKDIFEKTHGVRLGLMSFFVTACTEALKRFPIINASVEGTDILYHNYYDMGIAVSAPRGLVVPVIRDADRLTMADIEKNIIDMSQKAKNNQLTLEDLSGGTFTITNGGVFGSLMATPIINPPQSAILGMHKIEERPIALNGVVVIRPMMYIALSYDHRIIDGADSVRFLVTVKEILEDPARLCLGI